MTSKNIMTVGIDGRGTLPTSRILGKLVIGAGFDVKLSEVRGMAQCGGSVVTFVRHGKRVIEPAAEEGQAGVLIAFERLEALRCLHLLKEDGVVIVNDWRIDPTTVVTEVAQYLEGIIDRLEEVRRIIVVEATEEAKKMGAPKAFNVIVLGTAVKHMGSEKEDWLRVIETMVPPKAAETSEKAFEIGYTLSV